MKPFCILFCLWSFAVSAATNTVLTTTTNRTLAISALGAQMVSSNTAASVRTLLNVTNATGVEALLSGTNTFSGTNNFTGPVILTNAASTLAGDGSAITGIGVRLIGSSPTNIYLDSLSTTAASTLTNNGGWSGGTYVARITCSALRSSNAIVHLVMHSTTTNANTTAGTLYAYAGQNTNYVGNGTFLQASLNARTTFALNASLFVNYGSYTNQFIGGLLQGTPLVNGVTNLVDTSVPFDIYVCLATTTGFTNGMLSKVRVYAIE